MFPDMKFAIKIDTININTSQRYAGKRNRIFLLLFPWAFQESILKIAHSYACESEGYFTNHYNDNNIQSGNSIVMHV